MIISRDEKITDGLFGSPWGLGPWARDRRARWIRRPCVCCRHYFSFFGNVVTGYNAHSCGSRCLLILHRPNVVCWRHDVWTLHTTVFPVCILQLNWHSLILYTAVMTQNSLLHSHSVRWSHRTTYSSSLDG